MKLRIAIWAVAGALVVILWTLCIPAVSPTSPVQTLAYLTCPIALAGRYALSFWLVLLVNAATYAVVGMIVEATRQHFKAA